MTGSFNITQVALGTAFQRIGTVDENFASEVFDQFLRNRDIMQGRVLTLARESVTLSSRLCTPTVS